MALPTDRDVYDARCLRVAAVASARGIALSKGEHPGEHVLVVAANGTTVTFPIVTDDRTWRETSVEQAFYSVLVDARGWSAAHVDAASLATLVDDAEHGEMPFIRTDLTEALARIERLAQMLGGRTQLEALWQSVETATV